MANVGCPLVRQKKKDAVLNFDPYTYTSSSSWCSFRGCVVLLGMLGGSKVHLGPRSAGNKSLLSYRAGHGITGYGGYCPSSESIPIPIKEGPSGMGAQGVGFSPAMEKTNALRAPVILLRNDHGAYIAGKSWPRPASAHFPARGGSRPRKYLPCDDQQVPHCKARPEDDAGSGNGEHPALFKEKDRFCVRTRCYVFASRLSTQPLTCEASSISGQRRTICRRCRRRNSSAIACTDQHSTARRRTKGRQVTWPDATSQIACILIDQHNSHSFPAAGDTPFLSSPTRKKPAYLLGSTYSASYDNAMEMVHGQVKCTGTPTPTLTDDDAFAHFQAWLENKDPKLVQSVYGSLFKEVIVQPNDLNTTYERDFGSFGGGLAGKPVHFVWKTIPFLCAGLSINSFCDFDAAKRYSVRIRWTRVSSQPAPLCSEDLPRASGVCRVIKDSCLPGAAVPTSCNSLSTMTGPTQRICVSLRWANSV